MRANELGNMRTLGAVHIGARVMAAARSGGIMASATVKDLVIGSNLDFMSCGSFELKGVPGTWDLYEVQAQARRTIDRWSSSLDSGLSAGAETPDEDGGCHRQDRGRHRHRGTPGASHRQVTLQCRHDPPFEIEWGIEGLLRHRGQFTSGASHGGVARLALEALIGVGAERPGHRGAFDGTVGDERRRDLAEDVHADSSNCRASRALARCRRTLAAETEMPMASAISACDQS